MTREEIIGLVNTQLPGTTLGTSKQFIEFIIEPARIHLLANYLKMNPPTKMDYLFCLTAADRKDGFHVVYHLTSSVHGHSVMLRTIIADKANPVVPTVSDIWKAAEYYEREVYDLFGIRFENHPDLRRIFLDDDWVGYPLRKDYKDSFMLSQ